jgi:hypothetical protein
MKDRHIGMLLVGGAILTLAVILMLAKISESIKEAAWFSKQGGSLDINTAFFEVPFILYVMIALVLALGLYALFRKKS